MKIKYLLKIKELIQKDKNAICASKIFSSLNDSPIPDLKDYEDLELMYQIGYRNFMLQDDVKGPKLQRTIECWREFINE